MVLKKWSLKFHWNLKTDGFPNVSVKSLAGRGTNQSVMKIPAMLPPRKLNSTKSSNEAGSKSHPPGDSFRDLFCPLVGGHLTFGRVTFSPSQKRSH